MRWQAVAGGLEVSMGVAHSRAEIYDAEKNALRVTLTGSGSVTVFHFDEGGEAASRVEWNGVPFERTRP